MAVHPAIARRFLEEPLNNGNMEAIDQIMPADAIVHALQFQTPLGADGASTPVTGRDLLKNSIRAQRSAVATLHVEIDQFLDAGHTITAFCTLSGVSQNGKSASWNLVSTMHFHDSKIAELWYMVDRLGMYQQFGVVPESRELIERLAVH